MSCKDQGNVDVAYTNGAVDIAPGATVTCTFTNTKKPQLTVVKKIVGGNGTTDSFDVKVDGTTKIDDAKSTAPAGTSSGAFAVSAGQHTVTETLGNGSPVGGDWVVSFSGDCDASGKVDVQNDQAKTCTVTNSKLPRLRVVKEIEGGDGSVFDISVSGTKVLDDAGDGAADERTYAPGGYDVSETFGDGGAIGSDWTAVFSGDCDAAGHVSLAYGDAKTCTITNKRKPKLTVVKVIEGGNGASFDLKVNDSVVLERRERRRRSGDEHVPGRHRVLGQRDARQRQRRSIRPCGRPPRQRRLRGHAPRGRAQDVHDHEQAQAEADRREGDRGRQRRLVRPEGQRRRSCSTT